MKVSYWCPVVVAIAIGGGVAAAQGPPPLRAPTAEPAQAAAATRVEADLRALVADALQRNLPLLGERLTPEIAQAEIRAARAAFEPTVQFAPGLSRGSETTRTASGRITSTTSRWWYGNGVFGSLPYSSLAVAGALPTGTTYNVAFDTTRRAEDPVQVQHNGVEVDSRLTFSFAHPLLRGAGSSMARSEIRAADLSARAAMRRYDRAAEQTVAAVERAYWALAQAGENEAVARESLNRATTLFNRNEQLVRLTLVAEIDLLTARQAVVAREAALTEASRVRRDAAERLIFLVYGRDARDRLATADALGVSAPVIAPALPAATEVEAEALAHRPDVSAAREDVAVGGVKVEVARSDLKPSLYLNGSYAASTANAARLRLWGTDRLGDVAVTGFQAGLVLTVPVGNGLGKAGYRQATLARSQQELAVLALENDIRLQVRQTIRAITEKSRGLAQSEEALALARRQYEAETRRLELGLSDSFRLLQFEQVVAEAHRDVISARYALAFATSDYYLATGGNIQRYVAAGPTR